MSNEPSNAPGPLRSRWREYELIFFTTGSILIVLGWLWNVFNLSWEQIEDSYGSPFRQNGLTFDYARNVLLPGLGAVAAVYLAYLLMNLYILPRLLQPERHGKGSISVEIPLGPDASAYRKGVASKQLLYAVLQCFLLLLFLGAALGIADYYGHAYAYYLPGNRYDSPRIIFGSGLRKAFAAETGYILYAALREAAIRKLESEGGHRSFRLTLANQISAFCVGFLLLPLFLFNFDIITDKGFFIVYLGLIPPVAAFCLSNLFWLFPFKGTTRILKWPVLRRLLWSSALYTFPGAVILSREPGLIFPIFLMYWLGQIFAVTPISWLIYQQRKDRILQVRGLEERLGESNASLQSLRSQINPHFLFNALNTLYGTALQENAARAAEGIQKLGDMMRFMLHENNQDKIPMHKEIEYLQNYIDLQKLRTQSSASIHIHAEIEDLNCRHQIAPMLLIPFVENAFKHGISLQEASWVNIKLSCDEKSIFFEVRNSIHARQSGDTVRDKSGIGMKNVLNRLRLIYPRRHQFFVNGNEKEFFVQLVIEPGT